MKAVFKKVAVSSESILKAMDAFDSLYPETEKYDNWMSKGNYKHAVRHGQRLYPVKHILSEATSLATSEFSGGEQTNSVFRELGFQVIEKPVTNAARSAA